MKSLERLAWRKSAVVTVTALLAAAAAVHGQTQEVQTWKSFQIGKLILSDLQPGRTTLGAREFIDGIEYRHFHLVATQGKFEFRGDAGQPARLRGRLTNLAVTGLFSKAVLINVPPLFRVDREDFKMTLDPDISKLEGFYGATVHIPDRRVWVTNPERIEITPSSNQGTLAFPTHPVRLVRLSLAVPGVNEPLTADLTSLDPDGRGGGGRFEFSLSEGALRLVGGEFLANRRAPFNGTLKGDDWESVFTGTRMERLAVRVGRGSLDLEIRNLHAGAEAAARLSGMAAPLLARGSFKVGRIRAAAPFAADRAALGDLEISNLRFTPAVAAPSAVRAAEARCADRSDAVSEVVAGLLRGLGLPDPREQQMASIRSAADGLAQLGAPELVLHLTKERVLSLLRGPLGLPEVLVETIHFGRQEILQCLSPAELAPDLADLLPVELLVHYGLAIERNELVVRPAVRLVSLSEATIPQVSWSELLGGLASSARAGAEALKAEVRLPLPFRFEPSLDFSQAAVPGLTIAFDPVKVELAIQHAALLVDEGGFHLLATLR